MEEEKVKELSLNHGVNRLSAIVKEHVQNMDIKKRFVIDEDIESELPTKLTEVIAPSAPTESTESTRRTSSKQRKASLDEYRELFLKAPKITDRQPVFVSRATRDSIDELVRRLGERKMSVSGFLENLACHHLEMYREEVEQWKRL